MKKNKPIFVEESMLRSRLLDTVICREQEKFDEWLERQDAIEKHQKSKRNQKPIN